MAATLAAVGLTAQARQEIQHLSHGMKQRAGLAVALLGRPRLLLLDEPTAGLDPGERRRVLRVIKDRASGAVVLLATHLLEDVAVVCDQVLLLNEGRVAAAGPLPALLKTSPGSQDTGVPMSPIETWYWARWFRTHGLAEHALLGRRVR